MRTGRAVALTAAIVCVVTLGVAAQQGKFRAGVDLVLSGHTHGGQVSLRSDRNAAGRERLYRPAPRVHSICRWRFGGAHDLSPHVNVINQAGCLDRCEDGPCVVVYPDAVWYTYVDRSDIDEIIEEHLKHGRVVERLRM